MKVERVDSKESTVCKFVFTLPDAVFETVLYRYPSYEERTVICCSTMSGCPVGCRFCGAGDHFVRAATYNEIVMQVTHALNATEIRPSKIKKLQIMFMSMGEPLLNKRGIEKACHLLHLMHPRAALLISTMGPRIDYGWINSLSARIPAIGLQFSIHEPSDAARNRLIPFEAKLNLREIAQVGTDWHHITGRKPFFNYCAAEHNTAATDALLLANLFAPSIWEATVSVICERNEGIPSQNDQQKELATRFSERLINLGYNVRVFDPAGQDDIGGGCGQLWFVQKWMKENPDKTRPSIGIASKET